jgi:anion-transporting  ArsA/GET3 family ATPase
VETSSGVFVSYFDGAAALAEYLRRKVHLGALADKVFAHPLYDAFVRAAPGVKELMVIGKVRDELVLQKRWDAVVVDAGASGHALEYLRMPAAAAATFQRGRVHREARRVNALLSDAESTAVHVVTSAEEMPILEAIESTRLIRDELGLPLGRLIVNRCLAVPPSGIERAVARLSGGPQSEARRGVLLAAERARGWIRIQEQCIADLQRATGTQALRLPRLLADPFGLGEVGHLAHILRDELE